MRSFNKVFSGIYRNEKTVALQLIMSILNFFNVITRAVNVNTLTMIKVRA